MTKQRPNGRGGARPGAGRPRQYDESRGNLVGSVPESLIERTKQHAEQTSQTVSAIVEAAVAEYLAKRGV